MDALITVEQLVLKEKERISLGNKSNKNFLTAFYKPIDYVIFVARKGNFRYLPYPRSKSLGDGSLQPCNCTSNSRMQGMKTDKLFFYPLSKIKICNARKQLKFTNCSTNTGLN